MSAPNTNLEKEKRRHRGPLVGMIAAVVIVILGFVWWLGQEAAQTDIAPGPQTIPQGSPAAETAPTY
ncbi:MAG: hypothetical protein ACK4VZ_15785 [Paracoccaceae bacterium]